ncbi:MAG: hypothetical protein JNG88_12020 [Phycisphaerales bacterium]|nr:hypothetical protein [Phycisphaerales bacterium]
MLIPAAGIALFTDLVFGAKLSGRIRLLLVCAIGAATGLLLRVSPDWAFREALRTPQPPSARIALISRHYSGGPGEHVMIVEFEADWRDMLEILDSHGGTPLEEQDAALYERVRTDGGDWHKLFEALVPANVSMLARFHWQRIASITRPEIWVQRGDGMTWTYVIRDPTSRRVVLLCRCA